MGLALQTLGPIRNTLSPSWPDPRTASQAKTTTLQLPLSLKTNVIRIPSQESAVCTEKQKRNTKLANSIWKVIGRVYIFHELHQISFMGNKLNNLIYY